MCVWGGWGAALTSPKPRLCGSARPGAPSGARVGVVCAQGRGSASGRALPSDSSLTKMAELGLEGRCRRSAHAPGRGPAWSDCTGVAKDEAQVRTGPWRGREQVRAPAWSAWCHKT